MTPLTAPLTDRVVHQPCCQVPSLGMTNPTTGSGGRRPTSELLMQAKVDLERLEELQREVDEAMADADRQAGTREAVALSRATNAKAVMGGYAIVLARRLVAVLEEHS